MTYPSKTVIFISLMIMFAISPSLGDTEKSEVEKELRDLVSHTDEPEESWKIIKHWFGRFTDADRKIVAGVILNLTITRADEINKQLNRFHENSRNDELKRKYESCIKSYNDALYNLRRVTKNLGFDTEYVFIEIEDTIQDMKRCGAEFEGDSFDPAHIRNRQKEIGIYVKLVEVAIVRMLHVRQRVRA